ncbi:hypothetical protein [Streptomyces sp. NPDC002467]|uniref:hypothetical protein n=1 Tax=Streptomyces sp. NPDC002467 TaxID=3364647 RepID=UPI0036746ADE
MRRPFQRGTTPGTGQDGSPQISSGELEVAALEDSHTDPARAQALATAIGVRAALDVDFRVRLDEWWRHAQSTGGEVHNSVNGGRQNGPVVQGRDFSNLTFNMTRGTAVPDGDWRAGSGIPADPSRS